MNNDFFYLVCNRCSDNKKVKFDTSYVLCPCCSKEVKTDYGCIEEHFLKEHNFDIHQTIYNDCEDKNERR